MWCEHKYDCLTLKPVPSGNHMVRSAGILANVLNSAGETLVLLGIIILQANLEFHRFQEAALLGERMLQNTTDALKERVTGHFRPVIGNEVYYFSVVPNRRVK